MALAKKRSNSSRVMIIGAVVVAVAGVGYFLFREFFLKTDTGSGTNDIQSRRKSVLTNFGSSVLQDPRYQALKTYDITTQVDANRDGGQIEPFR